MTTAADRHRNRMAERSRAAFASVADIGEIPAVKDPARRARCQLDLHCFLGTYFPQSTGLRPFSLDHRRAIGFIQLAILEGGRFCIAFPRGYAKTTILENAIIWAALYGHRKYLAIFGADANMAAGNIDSIKLELSENDLLYEDFPEVIAAVRALEGKVQRCASQTYRGVLTHIEWTAEQIVLPTIPGSMASGAIVVARGLTGGSRGMKHKRPDGVQQRPDMVLIDDPQTDESAASPVQIQKRMDIIRKSILKLGGHAGAIACLMAATVIQPGDMVDQLLDVKRNPAWQGIRIPMVRSWSKEHETLWLGEYAKIRSNYNPDDVGDQARAHGRATEFYAANRERMDAGAEITWPECYDRATEVSAIQHAYNLLIDDGPEVFASECQNQPLPADTKEQAPVSAEGIRAKANGITRGVVPTGFEKLTAFVDVQEKALYWMTVAWGDAFTGHIVDYGTWPEQGNRYFSLREIKKTIARQFPGMGLEARLLAALDALAASILAAKWKREDGAELRIDRAAVDANWAESTEVVREFCRRSIHSASLIPSHGRFVSATSPALGDKARAKGEQVGHHWRLSVIKAQRHLVFDTNQWKSVVFARLAMAPGETGGITIFGRPDDHELLADHLTAEYAVRAEARGRVVDEWKLKPGRDNHWLDGLVGAAAAASLVGVSTAGMASGPKQKKRVSFAELQARKRMR